MNSVQRVLIALLGLSAALALAGNGWGATLRVPSEYATIQAGIDAAAVGDTVLVAPGTYTDVEVRNFSGANWTSCAFLRDGVILKSEAGSALTTIDMQDVPGPQGAVVNARNLPSDLTKVEGFTITAVPWVRGVYTWYNARMTFRDCVFRDLYYPQSNGAGLLLLGDGAVIDCEFRNCESNWGGGLYFSDGHLDLINTVFENCGDIGAALVGGDGGPAESAWIENCTFLNNWADVSAGGLGIDTVNASVVACWFEGNVAYGTGGGGLSWGNEGTKVIRDCVFVNNGTTGDNGQGGAIKVGSLDGVAQISGNTFYGNYQTYEWLGGATLAFYSDVMLENNIFAGSHGQEAVWVKWTYNYETSCNVYWNNAQGNGLPLSETDAEVDPLFCDEMAGDFTLSAGSPCLPGGIRGCDLIGARALGCGAVSAGPSLETESWARTKARFRRGVGDDD